MSWTSEHDPPSSRPPSDEPDDDAVDGPVDDVPTGLDDDGPLDPSVFDGLFDDLADDPEPHDVPDNPLDEFLTVTLTGDIDLDVDTNLDTEIDTAVGLDTELETGIGTGVELDTETGLGRQIGDETDLDHLDDGLGPVVADEAREYDGSFVTQAPDLDDDSLEQPVPPAMPTRAFATDDEFDQNAGLFFADTQPGAGEDVDGHGMDGGAEPSPVDEVDVVDEVDEVDVIDEQRWDDHDWEEQAGHEPTVHDPGDDDAFGSLDDDRATADHVDERPAEPVESLFGVEPAWFERGEPVEPALDLDSGPFRASPEIQHDPNPEPDEDLSMAPVDEEPVATGDEARVGRSRRLLAALAVAIVVGSSLGVAGAMLLTRLVDRDNTTPGTAAATGAGEEGGESAAATDSVGPASATARTGLTLASLGFETGGEAPTLTPSPTLDLLEALVAQDPNQPIVATVRTFTESTAAQDLELSRRQADALATRLVDLGADQSQVAVIGLGRSLLTSAQPVPNFVVPSTGLGPSDLAAVTTAIGPFAIGFDPAAAGLRPESLSALEAIASAMAADPDDRGLTLAAYSFDQRDSAANEGQAQLAAAAATAYLVEAGIDPARLTTIVAGDEPFAVPDRIGSHVDLRWGDAAVGPLALVALRIDDIDFEAGSTELGPEAADTIDRLGALLVQLGDEAVIDVHSFDGDEVQVRVDLSVVRAQAIGQRLLAAGVPAQRLRLHGGTSAQFRGEDRVSRMVVTLLQPPDRS